MRRERVFNWEFETSTRSNGVDKSIFIDKELGVYKQVITWYNERTGAVLSKPPQIKFTAGDKEFLKEADLFLYLETLKAK